MANEKTIHTTHALSKPDWPASIELACDAATAGLSGNQGYYTRKFDDQLVEVVFVDWGYGLEAAAIVHLDGGLAFMSEAHPALEAELARAGFDVDPYIHHGMEVQ